jgi:hypothetical protein
MCSGRSGPGARALALSALLFATGIGLPGGASAQDEEAAFTDQFRLGKCSFSSVGENPYFPLRPGFYRRYVGESDGEEVVLEIRVLGATRTVALDLAGKHVRVRTRVIEERESLGGEIVEISRNYFARCRPTDDVVYFGEEVDIYEDGEIVSHDGAWLAGKDGAEPGLVMPGTFLLGARYFQEIARNAMDRAEHVEMGLAVRTDAGRFSDCVRVIETTPLEPGAESEKVYCPGVGLTMDNDVELVDFGRGDDGGDD